MKTAVITGGNSGIGKAAAIGLAKKGYRIIILGRNPEKTVAAVDEIKAASGRSDVEGIGGSLSTVTQMKKIAAEIQKRTTVIDALVLSTGVILSKRTETADGMDEAFVAQYLCRFAMVNYLMPQLKNAAFARIAMVGAPTMKKAKIHFDDLSLKNNYTMMTSMGQAMLANHLFVQEFAKRHANEPIAMNIHHVGIAKTGVAREINPVLRGLIGLFGSSPEKGAQNTIYLADSDDVKFSGYFLPKPGKPEVKTKIAFDPTLASSLWERSLELIA